MMDMSDIIWMLIFFITAFFYSASGLGGASAYLAYFSIMKVDYTHIPATALFLSVISTFTSTINWIREKYINKTAIPFLIVSVPSAFLGGKIKLSEQTFNILLIITLLIVGILMFKPESKNRENGKIQQNITTTKKKIILALPISAAIGFVSGTIGIGGGVFLIPIIYGMGIMDYKYASATGAIFIFLNSISGLFGQITKQTPDINLILKFSAPVISGAFLGSFLSSKKFSANLVKKIFGGVVILLTLIKSAEILVGEISK
jgi:uncharacterized membrane protein YfcA